jgi:hypothetical protein
MKNDIHDDSAVLAPLIEAKQGVNAQGDASKISGTFYHIFLYLLLLFVVLFTYIVFTCFPYRDNIEE